MRDYQQLHLARWQADTLEDWQAELRKQGCSEDRIVHITQRMKYYTDKGINSRAAREQAFEDSHWQSSGQF